MGLLRRLQHMHEVRTWEGEIPIFSRYTVGIAGERFFREIKDYGRFWAARCPHCDVVYFPPRLYCERCFAHLEDWVEVPTTGRVHTFTVVHLDLDGNLLPKPRILAFVQIDGTDGGLVHDLGEVEPEEVCIGMCVEAVFREKDQRRGSITDILYFRPVRSG